MSASLNTDPRDWISLLSTPGGFATKSPTAVLVPGALIAFPVQLANASLVSVTAPKVVNTAKFAFWNRRR